MPQPKGPLGLYIDEWRQKRDLSWRRLSYLSGVSPETVGMMIRREGVYKPKADTLRGIVKALDVPYEQLLILAGLLDPPTNNKPSPEVKRLIGHILDIYQDIKDDPEAVKQLVNLTSTAAETVRALATHENEEQPA